MVELWVAMTSPNPIIKIDQICIFANQFVWLNVDSAAQFIIFTVSLNRESVELHPNTTINS